MRGSAPITDSGRVAAEIGQKVGMVLNKKAA